MNLASMSPATATSTIPSPPPFLPHQITSSTSSPSLLSFPHCTKTASSRIRVVICCAVSTGEGNRTRSGSGGEGEKWEYWTRRPVGTPGTGEEEYRDRDKDGDGDGDGGEEGDGVRWVDWEDQILDDTIPLVDLARRILHGKKYQFGDKLNHRHHRALTMLLLPYHPDYEEKIGCGVDYITTVTYSDIWRRLTGKRRKGNVEGNYIQERLRGSFKFQEIRRKLSNAGETHIQIPWDNEENSLIVSGQLRYF